MEHICHRESIVRRCHPRICWTWLQEIRNFRRSSLQQWTTIAAPRSANQQYQKMIFAKHAKPVTSSSSPPAALGNPWHVRLLCQIMIILQLCLRTYSNVINRTKYTYLKQWNLGSSSRIGRIPNLLLDPANNSVE